MSKNLADKRKGLFRCYRSGMPEETTVCKFRHLLEKHKLGCI